MQRNIIWEEVVKPGKGLGCSSANSCFSKGIWSEKVLPKMFKPNFERIVQLLTWVYKSCVQ